MSRRGRADDPVGRWWGELSRAALWHRRLLAAGLLAAAMAAALQALAPAPPPSVAVLSAARDLPGGARLASGDVRLVRRPVELVPAGALRRVADAAGSTVVSAVRDGEVLTDVRLLGPSTLSALGADHVATPVRIADAAAVRLLRAGQVVDVLAAGGGGYEADAGEVGAGGPARLVASAVRVLAVPRPGDEFAAAGGEGALVLLATTDATAARLAGAAVTDRLSVVLRHR